MTITRRTITISAVSSIAASGVALSGAAASAQPAGFPDVSAFAEASTNADFSRPDRWANGYAFFRTPAGISCMIGSLKQCHGPLPGLPAGAWGPCPSVTQSYEQASRSEPYEFEKSDSPCPPPSDTLLDVGQKLTLVGNDTTVCVVGANNLVACISGDRKHGFVVQPSGSWTF